MESALDTSENLFYESTESLVQSNWIKNADVVLLIRQIFYEFPHDAISSKRLIGLDIDEYKHYENVVNDIEAAEKMIDSSLFEKESSKMLTDKFSLLLRNELIEVGNKYDTASSIIRKSIRHFGTDNKKTHNRNGNDYSRQKLSLNSRKLSKLHAYSVTHSILRIASSKAVLVAEPVNVEFHNYQLNKLYQRKVIIKNVSNIMARYQLVRRNANTNFTIILNTRRGLKKNLAPGMQTVLTIFFRSHIPKEYIERMVLKVKRGKTIDINVHAFRENPILKGVIITNDVSDCHIGFFSPGIENKTQDSASCDAKIGMELDCNMCFVGEEIIVKMMITNVGGDGRFILMTEIDWHTMNTNVLSKNNEIVVSDFKIWPAYFLLNKNETVVLHTFFKPMHYGLHVDKFFIVCDNFTDQSVDVLGDGVMFHEDFIQFGKNLRHISSVSQEDDNSDYWIVEIKKDTTNNILQTVIDLTNLCELNIFYRWEIINFELQDFDDEDWNSSSPLTELSIEPMCGFFPASSNLDFKITATITNSILEYRHHICLQFIIEDIPRLAIPNNCSLSIYPSINKKRQCQHSVDICVGNIAIREETLDVTLEQSSVNHITM